MEGRRYGGEEGMMTVMGSRPLAGIGRRARDTGRWLVRMDGMPLYDWFDLVYILSLIHI